MITMVYGAPEQYNKYYSFDIIDIGSNVDITWKFALVGWIYYPNNSLRFFYIADASSADELFVWADLHGIEVNKDVVKTSPGIESYELYDILKLQYSAKIRTPSMPKVNACS